MLPYACLPYDHGGRGAEGQNPIPASQGPLGQETRLNPECPSRWPSAPVWGDFATELALGLGDSHSACRLVKLVPRLKGP